VSGTIQVTSFPDGNHELWTTFAGQRVLMVRVRPVGQLASGDLFDYFSPDWVPQMIEALQLAKRIAEREKPWEPWETKQ
jgi:hypothetical protein